MSYKKDMPRKKRALLKNMGWEPEEKKKPKMKPTIIREDRMKPTVVREKKKTPKRKVIMGSNNYERQAHRDAEAVNTDTKARSGYWWAVIFFVLIAIFTVFFTLIGKYLT